MYNLVRPGSNKRTQRLDPREPELTVSVRPVIKCFVKPRNSKIEKRTTAKLSA